MTTPMSDKRLAAITDHCERRTEDAAESWDDMSSDYAVELLEEVERLRDELEQLRAATDAILLIASVLEGLPRYSSADSSARVAELMAKAIQSHVQRATPQQPEPTGGAQ